MRLISIASGSSGNCIYVGTENTHILVDAGISYKKIEEGLNHIGLTMKDIDAVLVTHEHIDHIKGIGVINRKTGTPVYSTRGTLQGITENTLIGKISLDAFNTIETDRSFCIGDINVNPFHTYHDAKEPCAYTFSAEGKRAGVVTDLGKYDDYIVNNLKDLNAILVESNHDVNMVQVGSYPYKLKQRILSDIGHLSNEACGCLLGRIINDNMKGILLGHISADNNYEALAYETVRTEIDMNDSPYKADDFEIRIADRNYVTKLVEF